MLPGCFVSNLRELRSQGENFSWVCNLMKNISQGSFQRETFQLQCVPMLKRVQNMQTGTHPLLEQTNVQIYTRVCVCV